MPQFTDAEIIKALVCCIGEPTCGECPMNGECEEIDLMRIVTMLPDVLKRHEIELEAMRTAANSYKMHYENVVREIFEEIGTLIEEYLDGLYCTSEFVDIFTERKKRYTGEKGRSGAP